MKNFVLIVGIVAFIFLAVGGIWLYAQQAARPTVAATTSPSPAAAESSTIAQVVLSNTSTPGTPAVAATPPTVGTPVVTPSLIAVNTPTPVTVTVQITAPTLIAGSVNLLLVGATGTQPTILGTMQSAGNGTYTFQTIFNEPAPGQLQLEVSAAFQGLLKRVLSASVQVPVWDILTDASSGLTAAYPPSLHLTSNPLPGVFFLDSSASGVAIGGAAPPPGTNEATSGYRIVISATPYGGSFNLNQYLSAEYPNSVADIASVASTSIGGQVGYEFTFQNEEAGGKPVAIVYDNGFVYEIDYASTNYIPGFTDQDGLNAFYAVLQHITLD